MRLLLTIWLSLSAVAESPLVEDYDFREQLGRPQEVLVDLWLKTKTSSMF